MTRPRDIYGPGSTQAEYRRALRAGYDTGCWDENGIPAPWPEDFLDPHSGWQPSDQPGQESNNPSLQNGDEPPF
jgi:hypothetical protein